MEKKGRFDQIVLETTGLADPAPIIQAFWNEPALNLGASTLSFLLMRARRKEGRAADLLSPPRRCFARRGRLGRRRSRHRKGASTALSFISPAFADSVRRAANPRSSTRRVVQRGAAVRRALSSPLLRTLLILIHCILPADKSRRLTSSCSTRRTSSRRPTSNESRRSCGASRSLPSCSADLY